MPLYVSILLLAAVAVLCGKGRKYDTIGGEEECEMTKRIDIIPAPEPLEAYARHFDDLFGKSNQREGFRRYLEGLLLPTERHKTLTGLANTEPLVGAQLSRAQRLQWFLSESTWDERQVQAKRLGLLREDPSTGKIAVCGRGCAGSPCRMCWPSNPRMRGGIQRRSQGRCKTWRTRRAGRVPSTPASGYQSPGPSAMGAPNSGGCWRSWPGRMGQTRRNGR